MKIRFLLVSACNLCKIKKRNVFEHVCMVKSKPQTFDFESNTGNNSSSFILHQKKQYNYDDNIVYLWRSPWWSVMTAPGLKGGLPPAPWLPHHRSAAISWRKKTTDYRTFVSKITKYKIKSNRPFSRICN